MSAQRPDARIALHEALQSIDNEASERAAELSFPILRHLGPDDGPAWVAVWAALSWRDPLIHLAGVTVSATKRPTDLADELLRHQVVTSDSTRGDVDWNTVKPCAGWRKYGARLRELLAESHQETSPAAGLTREHWAVLEVLADAHSKPLLQAELEAAPTDLPLSRHTIGPILRDLRDRGLVARPGRRQRKGDAITLRGLDVVRRRGDASR